MSNDPLTMAMRKWVEASSELAKIMEQEKIKSLAPTIQLASGKQGRLTLEIVDKAEMQEKAA
ncbi:molybdopterin biosynthesis protein MoeC [uncultured Cardiobacterium sp.]|uniref:molybdopterin biosynthesis protein MoeC n=1 Tax=uncultured Cardiobacterium sp. TaxID=417619 RepID=UPI002619564D|nr:molybdopterin biosynthesis protein MoeC [uncultured Cardiobacterium sp.]